jgi:hypothetical protein
VGNEDEVDAGNDEVDTVNDWDDISTRAKQSTSVPEVMFLLVGEVELVTLVTNGCD